MVPGLARAGTAGAAVRHAAGFRATVDGWTSWYGSYELGALGAGWCVDHGLTAPDAVLGYVPTTLGLGADRTTALAWLYGRAILDGASDPVVAASTMLAGHDLLGARYPGGRLDVDRLTTARMAGFGARATAVLDGARRRKADALAHGHLRGPVTVRRAVPSSDAVEVVDANGKPVVGARTKGADGRTATTDAAGRAGVGLGAATVTMPALSLEAFGPTRARAQRVARGGRLDLALPAAEVPKAPPPETGTLTVRKLGEQAVPVTGAGFRARLLALPDGSTPTEWSSASSRTSADLEVGADGVATATRLRPGRWEVTEVRPPAGYGTAGPWTVVVAPSATLTLEAQDRLLPRPVRVRKVDADTGGPVAGARLRLRRLEPPDPGGAATVETTTTLEPWTPTLSPGRWELTEVEAPAGYVVLPAPIAVVVAPLLDPAEPVLEVVAQDRARTTLRFAKAADGPFDERLGGLAGAVFVVRVGEAEVGRCTTGADGTCSLPDRSLVSGDRACWTEEVAPTGFEPAAGACVLAGHPSAATVVRVVERSTFATLVAHKRDTEGGGLAGAVYDLVRMDDGPALAAPVAPSGGAAAVPEGTTWIARATSGDDGVLAFPPLLPGRRYCLVERTAPVGFDLAPAPVCTTAPVAARATVELTAVDERTEAPATTTTTTTTRAPATTTTTATATVARVPEPVRVAAPELPRTGVAAVPLAAAAVGFTTVGAVLAWIGGRSRRRRRPRRLGTSPASP